MKKSTANTTQAGSRMGESTKKPRRVISPLLQQALDAGRRVCDDWQDSPAARQQMKRDILETADYHPEQLGQLVLALTTLRCKRTDFFPNPQPTKE